MSSLILGSIMLYNGVGTSDKEFLIEIVKDASTGFDTTQTILTKHGPRGKLRDGKDYGTYSWTSLNLLMKSKLAKGYEITIVNGKPFLSGDIDDAQRLVENGNDWGALKTSQPAPKIKSRAVEFTFNAGQVAPVW